MGNYKGDIKSLNEITVGSPVEIVDPSIFNVESTQPLLGIVKQIGSDPNNIKLKYPVVDIWDGVKFTNTYLFSKGYNRSNYSGHGVLPECNAVKVLTGTKGMMLLKQYESIIDYDNMNFEQLCVRNGTDPEIFVVNKEGNVIPAWLFLPDSKAPLVAYDEYNNFKVTAYWDGVQAEFTTYAAHCLSWVIDSVQASMKLINKTAKAYDPNCKLSMKSVIDLSDDILINSIDQHLAFGCNPSLNAYGKTGQKVENPRMLPFRFAGGHIHQGYTFTEIKAINTVKALDAILGVLAVGMFAKMDDARRRRFYGMAGEYRRPAHGLEYRVLSNALFCHPAISFLMFDLGRYASGFGYNDTFKLLKYDEEQTQSIINNCDVDEARKVIKAHQPIYDKIARNIYSRGKQASDLIMHMGLNGVESVLDPSNLEENWRLNKPGTQRSDITNKTQWVPHGDGIGENFNSFCALPR